MGINLRNYVKNVNEILTPQEAERLLIAAGYIPIKNNDNTVIKPSEKNT